MFHDAGVRLCHVPDAKVRCPAERRNCHPQYVCYQVTLAAIEEHPGNTCS